MTSNQKQLQDYVKSLYADINKIRSWEEDISPLDCCDNLELEILENVYDNLKDIDLDDIPFHDALDIVQAEDDWMDYIDTFTPYHIAGTLPGLDMEELARIISNGPDADTASRLLDELLYWRERGRI